MNLNCLHHSRSTLLFQLLDLNLLKPMNGRDRIIPVLHLKFAIQPRIADPCSRFQEEIWMRYTSTRTHGQKLEDRTRTFDCRRGCNTTCSIHVTFPWSSRVDRGLYFTLCDDFIVLWHILNRQLTGLQQTLTDESVQHCGWHTWALELIRPLASGRCGYSSHFFYQRADSDTPIIRLSLFHLSQPPLAGGQSLCSFDWSSSERREAG